MAELDDNVWTLLNDLTRDRQQCPVKLSSTQRQKPDMTGCNTETCEFCGDVSVILHDGDYFCQKCGSLAHRFIDSGAEWRNYGAEDNKCNMTRCGMPVNDLLPNAFLGSMIGYGAYRDTGDIRIMRKYHLWNSTSYKERSLFTIFDSLTQNAGNNGIPKSIIEEAKALYKQISDAKISRGNNRCGLIAASIYMSCKNNKVPRSTKEIAGFFNIKLPVMTKSCKKFQEILKTKPISTSAEDFISRYCSKLNMDKYKKEICKEVVRRAEKEDIVSENTPPSIAAGVIYLCCVEYKWNIDKKTLAASCEISQVTVTKCFKKLLQHRDYLFDLQPTKC